ncbi:hypothetical protein PFX98_08070 [Paucibacter sediminis]|uniref:Uncharacterized protein n=1 Tax=Paucibacter sediminis TaxID=3019553 RepID=A0AA95NE24_9BURK|nr:hypothetical protein [Paucibacter sp. S2-9]WIT13560.1 hypothetical protein PFX98_08070 [Paucibacter sp. S2-9]
MTKRLHPMLAVWVAEGLLLLCSAAAQAQPELPLQLSQLLSHESLRFAGDELGQERVVKGAPYCAEAQHETVQTLADGNRIVQSQTSRLCRDGEGRTRQELERNGQRSIYLRDPVAQESWVLDPERKSARRLGGMAAPDAQAWREFAEQIRAQVREQTGKLREQALRDSEQALKQHELALKEHAAALKARPPEPVVITQQELDGGDGKTQRRIEVQVLRPGSGPTPLPPLPGLQAPPLPPLPPAPPTPPAVHLRALQLAPRGAAVVSPLPAKEIEGLRVNGERSSWTIAAGKLGNEKPIVITREVWSSPELMITVATRDFDPRSGEVNYRLRNIRRGEPDAALMRPPADYSQPEPRPAARPAPKASARG